MLRHTAALTIAATIAAPAAAQDWPPFVGAVQAALQKDAVDLSDISIEFFQGDALNRQCAGNPRFMDTVQGVSAAILYYTIAERDYRGLSVTGELSYPPYLDFETGNRVTGVDAVDLAAALGPDGPMALLPVMVSWIPAEMRPMALASAGYLLDTFAAFKTTLARNPDMQQYALSTVVDTYGPEPLYQSLGLPPTPDVCYTLPFHLRMSVNGERTYVSLGALDHYAYTFWVRRMAEGTMPEAFALLQEAVFQMQ